MSQDTPDLTDRGWVAESVADSDQTFYTKLFSFSSESQYDSFMRALERRQQFLNSYGEVSLYEGFERIRFTTFNVRLARNMETIYTNLQMVGESKRALFLDFDGTVRGVVEDPARAKKGGFRAPYCSTEVDVFPQVSDILQMW